MSINEVERLVKRAEKFRRDAASYAEGHYDIACFYAEQAAQLLIKAYLLRSLGFIPRFTGFGSCSP